jgi:hypothetical protein
MVKTKINKLLNIIIKANIMVEHPRMGIHKVAIQTIIHQVEGVITVKAITATIIKTVRNNNALGRPNLNLELSAS